jgi:eukaryotic-like serine/threonine-protein kinase
MTQENLPGRYTILRELGRGAIGAFYAARDASTGAQVALKILHPALFSEANAKLAELFLKNARSAARLRHRNIVRIFDAGEAGGTAFVASELVEGESLRHMLEERPLSIARAIQIFDDIASALAYAHEEGMVHRGVKPSNIIVLREGVAKIGDFGTGQIGAAALPYTSPEQVRGDPVDHRSDLFSLGAVFYEMLTRRAPFEGDTPEQIRENILRAEPPLPSKVNPHVPSALDALVLRMLARHPDDRFTNARVLLRDLQRVEEELGLGPGAGARNVSVPAVRPEPSPAEDLQHRSPVPAGEAFHAPDASFIKEREPRPEQSSESRASLLAALALMLAMVSIGLTVVLYYSPDLIDRLTLASRIQEAPKPPTAAAPSPPIAPPPVTEARKEPPTEPAPAPAAPEASPPPATSDAKPEESSGVASASPLPPQPLVEEPGPSAQAESLLPAESEKPAAGETAPTPEAPRAKQPRAKVAEPQAGAMARLLIAVSPRGELYIDGEHYGTTPPITTLELAPGMHRIEVRSGSRKPYVTYMTVQGGEERRIRHDFNAKSSRPPG